MDLKKEVKVGDYVQYIDNKKLVCDEDGIPLQVVEVMSSAFPCIVYSNGAFDYISEVEVAPSLLRELL